MRWMPRTEGTLTHTANLNHGLGEENKTRPKIKHLTFLDYFYHRCRRLFMTFGALRTLLWSHFIVFTINLCRTAVKVMVFLSFENLLICSCQAICPCRGAIFFLSQETVNHWHLFFYNWPRNRTPNVAFASWMPATGQWRWNQWSIQDQLEQLFSRSIQKTTCS